MKATITSSWFMLLSVLGPLAAPIEAVALINEAGGDSLTAARNVAPQSARRPSQLPDAGHALSTAAESVVIAQIDATATAPPTPIPTSAAFASLASGPCADPWVSDTVAKTLNRVARGSGKNHGECNISRYGNGAWSDYADLLKKTQAAYSVCSDRWVSAAVWEALGRAPQGSGNTVGDCNHARYSNGSWNSYDNLVSLVRMAFDPANAARTPVSVATVPARSVSVRSTYAAGKCLDVSANQGLLLWDCHGGANQRISQDADGSLKYNGQCLANSGNTLRFESCNSGAIHQKWRIVNGAAQNGNVPPTCVDIENGSRNNGARLLGGSCHGGANQQWSFAQ